MDYYYTTLMKHYFIHLLATCFFKKHNEDTCDGKSKEGFSNTKDSSCTNY